MLLAKTSHDTTKNAHKRVFFPEMIRWGFIWKAKIKTSERREKEVTTAHTAEMTDTMLYVPI